MIESVAENPAVPPLDDRGLHLMDPAAQLGIGSLLKGTENAFQPRTGLLKQFRHRYAGGLLVVVVQQFEKVLEIIGHRLTAFPERIL